VDRKIRVHRGKTKKVLTTSGTNAKFKHMKMRYPFHFKLLSSVGVIITTKKFQIQFALIPTAVPLARTCRGRISGTYTHGMQFAVAPKISTKVESAEQFCQHEECLSATPRCFVGIFVSHLVLMDDEVTYCR
jgi:hypothetical protein